VVLVCFWAAAARVNKKFILARVWFIFVDEGEWGWRGLCVFFYFKKKVRVIGLEEE